MLRVIGTNTLTGGVISWPAENLAKVLSLVAWYTSLKGYTYVITLEGRQITLQ